MPNYYLISEKYT